MTERNLSWSKKYLKETERRKISIREPERRNVKKTEKPKS